MFDPNPDPDDPDDPDPERIGKTFPLYKLLVFED